MTFSFLTIYKDCVDRIKLGGQTFGQQKVVLRTERPYLLCMLDLTTPMTDVQINGNL